MADTYKTVEYLNGISFSDRSAGVEHVVTAAQDFTLDTNDDKILALKLPTDGIALLGATLVVDDMDSGSNMLLDYVVTDGTTTYTLINDSTIGQAGGAAVATPAIAWYGKVIEGAGWEVQIRAPTAGTTAGTFVVGIEYTHNIPAGQLTQPS